MELRKIKIFPGVKDKKKRIFQIILSPSIDGRNEFIKDCAN